MSRDVERPLGVRTVEDLPPLSGKRVLVRATLDLPLGSEPAALLARLRLARLVETARALKARGAQVTVFGDTYAPGRDPQLHAEKRIADELEVPGVSVVTGGESGSVEEGRMLDELVDRHDAFVNDSFQWSYLPLPSLLVPAGRLPSAAGRGLEHDLRIAAPVLRSPKRPFVAVLGGDNSQLRLHGLQGLVLRADRVLVGGAMSLPMLEAVGKRPRNGIPEWFVSECRAVIGLSERVQHQVHLPLDLVVRRRDGTLEVCEPGTILDGDVVDVGPLTARRFAEEVHGADTVVWAGALGHVEDRAAAAGTLSVADGLRCKEGQTVVMGGDSLSALLYGERRLERRMDIITATDSLLELFKNGDLPALPALRS